MSSGRKGKLFLMFSSSFGQCAFALGAGCPTALSLSDSHPRGRGTRNGEGQHGNEQPSHCKILLILLRNCNLS